MIKDLSILLNNRSAENIFVVESNAEFCDEDSVQSLTPECYDGSAEYKNLVQVAETIEMMLMQRTIKE